MKYLGVSDVLILYYSSLDFFRFQIGAKLKSEFKWGGACKLTVGGGAVSVPRDLSLFISYSVSLTVICLILLVGDLIVNY